MEINSQCYATVLTEQQHMQSIKFKFSSHGSPLSVHVKCSKYIVWNKNIRRCVMCQVKKSTAPLNIVNYVLLRDVTDVFEWTHATDGCGTHMCPYPLEWTKARRKGRAKQSPGRGQKRGDNWRLGVTEVIYWCS